MNSTKNNIVQYFKKIVSKTRKITINFVNKI